MHESYYPGDSVTKSGLYRACHDPAHPGVNLEVTFIRGRKFPNCPYCKTVRFELLYADKLSRSHPRTHHGVRKSGSKSSRLIRAGKAVLVRMMTFCRAANLASRR